MRIAMIGQKGIPAVHGGIERHVEELSVKLVKRGHTVLAYARAWYTPKEIKEWKGIKNIHLPTIHTKHLDAIVHTFLSTLNAIWNRVDVIHYHGVGPALLSFLPRIFAPKTKVVVTFHCIDRYHQKWNRFARLALKLGEKAACTFAHVTIAVSQTIQAYCLNEYHKKTIYLPNGAPQVAASTNFDLHKFGLKKNQYVVMVSRLVRHKGAHYLINAWKIAKQKFGAMLNDYKLAIVGGSAFTDSYVNELKIQAGGDESIVFAGWQKGELLEQFYSNAKLLVHPSENEGLPITVLHAMAYGKPVLLSDIPEHKEIIDNRACLFESANPDDLAQRLVELITDPKLMEQLGKENQKIAKEKYNWDEIAAATEKVYSAPAVEPSPIVLQTAKN